MSDDERPKRRRPRQRRPPHFECVHEDEQELRPDNFVWVAFGPEPDARAVAGAERAWRRLTGLESVTSCERCGRATDELALSDQTVPPLWLCPECHRTTQELLQEP